LREVISFDHLDVLVFRENSSEIDWRGQGEGSIAFPDIPVEETARWHVYHTQEPLHVADWNADATFPRLKRLLEKGGRKVGSVIRVPLTTAHRRLGALGISSQVRNAYRSEDVCFLQVLARVVGRVAEAATV
jgi:formate hydrogenlyase transcriptional activator